MRILLDTNVVISLEDDKTVQADVAKLARLCSGKHVLLIHPEALADVRRDKNMARAAITLTKLAKYKQLEKPPTPTEVFLAGMAPGARPNDVVDAHLLWAVKMNAVQILVTNDIDLARRARTLGIEERVHDPVEAVEFLEGLERPEPRRHTAIEGVPVHDLNPSDGFFDSLRHDYPEFNDWLARSSQNGRRCYVLREGGKTEAVMIYKDEPDPAIEGVPANVLKIATLKVSDAVRGQKVGELFLKLAFKMAFSKGFRGAYVTVYPKHRELCALFETFGMKKVGQRPDKRGGAEDVYYKAVEAPADPTALLPLGVVQGWYPCFADGARVRKYLVPIQPPYHDRLFPEVKGRQMRLADFAELITEGNTIKKAYISRSPIGNVRPGALLLFYRSEDTRALTSIGVVEEAVRCSAPEEVIARVGKRTVYSEKEVREICAGGEVLVLMFWHVADVSRPATFDQMLSLGVVRGSIQSIQELSHDSYRILKEVMEIDKRSTVD